MIVILNDSMIVCVHIAMIEAILLNDVTAMIFEGSPAKMVMMTMMMMMVVMMTTFLLMMMLMMILVMIYNVFAPHLPVEGC